MRRGERFRKHDACVRTQRPRDFRRDANSRDELDVDGILLDQTERAFKLQTTLRVVNDLRALEARTSMHERVCLHECARKLATDGSGGGLLHD